MIFKKKLLVCFCFTCFTICISAQPFIDNNFRSPVGIPILLSGNFGELRSNHFHSGLDIKTNGTINYRIYAIDQGYVSRINISHWGYGKAIYVDHPNGYTSVYAHLNHFPPKIEKLIREYQYKNKSEIITYYPDSGQIQVSKGEVIAYSGNSGGSSGPHLHFEIRNTKSEHPINPQLFGFEIQDDKPPVINKLKVYSLSNSSVNKKCSDQEFKLKKNANTYQLLNDSIIRISGQFGLGVSTVDYYNKTYNKCGIYAMQVFIDQELIFDEKINELDFETSKNINVYKDYKSYLNKRESIHKAFIHPMNELSFYKRDLGNGVILFEDENLHKVQIIVADIKGNSCSLSFYVQNSTQIICNDVNKLSIVDYGFKHVFSEDSNWLVSYDSTTFYENFPLNLSVDNDDVIHIGSIEIPVREKFTIALKLNKSHKEFHNKMLLAHLDNNGRIKNRKGKVNDNWLSAKVNHMGDFKVLLDTTPPVIKPINQLDKSKLNHVLKFKVTDNLSGVEEYQVLMNGNWVLSNYNYKTAQLSIPLNNYANLSTGKYNCEIIVKDERENETRHSFNFSFQNN